MEQQQQAMSDEVLAKVRPLFQESYKVIYEGGKFQTMVEQAKADGNPINAVAQLVTAVLDSTIKDAGVTDLETLYTLSLLLIADLLEGLQQVGMEAQEGTMEQIVSKTISSVLTDNPAFAQIVLDSPQFKELQASAGGQVPAAEAAPQQGVMGTPEGAV